MDPTHLHLLLNHVSVISVPLGLTLLVWAGLRRNREVFRAALAVFVLAAAVTIPVYLTGEPAEETIERVAPADQVVERHEEAASLALTGTIALGVVALVALATQRLRPTLAPLAGAAAGALAVVAFASLAWTASLGGQIRHTEIRADATAASAPAGYADHDDD